MTLTIAEDSPTQREVLLAILEEAGEFEVVGTARDGQEALSSTERLRPDIVLMDCHMPKANGFEATRMIMQQCPTPIVMVSSTLSQGEIEQTFEAIKSGAERLSDDAIDQWQPMAPSERLRAVPTIGSPGWSAPLRRRLKPD